MTMIFSDTPMLTPAALKPSRAGVRSSGNAEALVRRCIR